MGRLRAFADAVYRSSMRTVKLDMYKRGESWMRREGKSRFEKRARGQNVWTGICLVRTVQASRK
jgi:hypothetical protein